MELGDADRIIDGLHARGQTSLHSALDNVRNMVGSPLAGIDHHEMVDTRPYTEALNDLISLNTETGERGNPVWSNLPRKFNIAVSGSRDDFAHTHINDIGFQPCVHATTGEMGFNIVLGGYMSTKRVAEAIDMNVWIPADVDIAVEVSRAILRIFRDEGGRKDRQTARLMWLVESYGAVTEVDGHPRCHPDYREAVLADIASYGTGFESRVEEMQPQPTTPHAREGISPASSYLGVHAQPQEGFSRVGVHVPVSAVHACICAWVACVWHVHVQEGFSRVGLGWFPRAAYTYACVPYTCVACTDMPIRMHAYLHTRMPTHAHTGTHAHAYARVQARRQGA